MKTAFNQWLTNSTLSTTLPRAQDGGGNSTPKIKLNRWPNKFDSSI